MTRSLNSRLDALEQRLNSHRYQRCPSCGHEVATSDGPDAPVKCMRCGAPWPADDGTSTTIVIEFVEIGAMNCVRERFPA